MNLVSLSGDCPYEKTGESAKVDAVNRANDWHFRALSARGKPLMSTASKPKSTKPVLQKDIAARINAHLKRFEADPAINYAQSDRSLKPYFQTNVWSSSRWVLISYVSFQGHSSLSRLDAERYLRALDTGYVGKHFGLLQGAEPK